MLEKGGLSALTWVFRIINELGTSRIITVMHYASRGNCRASFLSLAKFIDGAAIHGLLAL